ncbi:MAG: VOC family protein [Tardiphaga sp.]|nr:VOC family protein [Tardiphaga sp.]
MTSYPTHIPQLHHVTLKTTRLADMIAWYGIVTGMNVHFQFPGGAWLSNDAANHRLALLTSPVISDDPAKLAHTGLHHTAFEFADLDALLDTYGRLREDGIAPHMSLDHGMTLSIYYVDPDGNSVELQCDTFGDWEHSTQWMKTSAEFAVNPIGMAFDGDRLLEARAAGASSEEIHRRAYAGEFAPGAPLDLRMSL